MGASGSREGTTDPFSNPNDADDVSRRASEGRTLSLTPDDALRDSMMCSPMVSTPRVVMLPDLDARDREQRERDQRAERVRSQRESARENGKRRRAASLGSARDGGEGTRVGATFGGVVDHIREEWAATVPAQPNETARLLPMQNVETGTANAGVIPEEDTGRRKRLVQIISGTELDRKGSQETITSFTSMFSMASSTPSPTPSYVDAFAGESNPASMSVLYGLINTAIVLPVIISFGSIIYQDEAFRPYLPVLVKLTVISGVVHQVCFSTFSGLPFAIGQVQDAGLIFLSAMASDMVRRCREGGHDDEAILATVTIGLGIFTAILGFGLVIIGRCRLASYVQMLPTPVVGGYLAFIGFFCGQSGMGLMAGVNVSGVLEWGELFAEDRARLVLPGIAGGLVIYVLVRMLKHFAVLPACILVLVSLFYAILGLTGTTVEEAREDGWISQADDPPVWYHTWDYLKPSKVVWSTLPHQTLTVLSMIFVVALSSSLDVAAIELELGRPLDYNRELRMVGLSNAVSGLTGGYTGSYIFSQSIFALRSGIRSRLSGYVVAACEGVTIFLPFSILSFVPNFFFGSLLIMIAFDLCYEWLWEVRRKVTSAEYSVALGTFLLIQVAGVEYGILLGIVLYFALSKLGCEMSGPSDGGGSPAKAPTSVEGETRDGGGTSCSDSSTKTTMPACESGGSSGIFIDYGGVSTGSCPEDNEIDTDDSDAGSGGILV